jgi:hypothetical protein
MYVYIMTSGIVTFPRTKVGIAKDPEFRRQTLQIGSPYPVKICQAWWVSTRSNAMRIEREVHRRLDPKHAHGEWFKCVEGTAMKVLHEVLREHGLLQYWKKYRFKAPNYKVHT